MKLSFWLATSLLLVSAIAANAQITRISGKVIDSKTRQPVDFATVNITNTTKAVTTAFDGTFSLETNAKDVQSVTVSFIGYAEQIVPVVKGVDQVVTVLLVEEGVQGVEIIVEAKRIVNKDTAAIRLFKRVVANKAQNRGAGFETQQYEDYVKTEFDLYNLKEGFKENKLMKKWDFVFENMDTMPDGTVYLPALLRETISDVYISKSKGKKEVLKAQQFSGINNLSVGELVDYTFEDIDIYDNTATIGGKTFGLPFSGDGLNYYKYFIHDTIVEMGDRRYSHAYDRLYRDKDEKAFLLKDTSRYGDDGKLYFLTDTIALVGDTIIKLDFIGRRTQDLAFTGFAEINLRTAAIQYVDMTVLGKVNLNYVNDFAVKQRFTEMGNGFWFKTKEEMLVSMNVTKSKAAGSLRIIKQSSKDKIKLDEPIESSKFGGDPVEIMADANEKGKEYWASVRHESLNKKEKEIYQMVDSVKSTGTFKTLEWLAYLGTTAYFRAGPVEFGRFYKFVSWNNIEGIRLRFGGRTTPKLSKKIQLEGYGAYGLADKEWKYYGAYRQVFPGKNRRWNLLTVEYKYDLSQLSQQDVLLTHDNIMVSALRPPSQPVMNLMKERVASISLEKEFMKGFVQTFGVQHRTFYELPGSVEFNRLNEDGSTTNFKTFTLSEVKLRTRWTRNKFLELGYYRMPVTFIKPVVTLDLAFGIKGVLGGEYNYQKVDLTWQHRLPSTIGYTNYTLFVGKVFGSAPFPLLEIHRGNQSFLHNKLSYNLMREFEFVSDEYAGLWFDHHFEGLLFNQIPLIKKLKWRELIYFRGVAGRLTPENRSIMNIAYAPTSVGGYVGLKSLDETSDYKYGWYMETGFGIENIFNIFRIDFLWRLTQLDNADVNKFGFRVAIQPKF